jgi:enoyl-CoA hydratase/carnithine racemase
MSDSEILDFQPPASESDTRFRHLRVTQAGALLHVRLARPEKRNAVNEEMLEELHACFRRLPSDTRAVIVTGEGEHFCAGLDLTGVVERDSLQSIAFSRRWHAAFEDIQFGTVPVIAVLHGAVVGGGLELAAACHLRVAEASAYFGLPECERGIFVGGSGSVRIPRLIGVSRMTDMMLTGRVLDADKAEQMGLVNYVVPEGQGWSRAQELATRIARNAPTSNYAVIQGLPRIADQSHEAGLFTESLLGTITQQAHGTRDRLQDFLVKRSGKVVKGADA